MTALYVISRYLTFPGAMVRGLWEHIVCRICGIPVEDNRLLRSDELCSHVEHEFAQSARHAFALCFVPAFMNGLLAFLLAFPSLLSLFYFEQSGLITIILGVVSYWFAFSLYVNSYPLVEDALNMKEQIYKHGTVLQKIFYSIGFPFLYIGAFCEKYLITFVLAVIGLVGLILI